jgi:8-hydroxy-5-deazaflavin:NADPH oxidoreductase
MRIGIIGAGPIGGSVAEQRVCHGDGVAGGFQRDPRALIAIAEETGASAGSVAEAAER